MMNFGGAVKDLRKQKGLKQKDFASILGITAPYLSQIENNEQKPSVDLMVKMANYFGLPVSAIVYKALNMDQLKNKEQKKYFEAAQSIIDPLINFLLSDDSKTKGKNPLNNVKSNLRRRKTT